MQSLFIIKTIGTQAARLYKKKGEEQMEKNTAGFFVRLAAACFAGLALLVLLAGCNGKKDNGSDEKERIKEKGMIAYSLEAEGCMKAVCMMRNDVIRQNSGGDRSGEITMFVYERTGRKKLVTSVKLDYDTAASAETETLVTLETDAYPDEASGSFLVSLVFQSGKEQVESLSLTVQDFTVQLGADSVKCVVAQMTGEEKARLVTGYNILPDFDEHAAELEGTLTQGAVGATAAIPRLGIPSIKLTDGTAGVRVKTQCVGYPSETVLANSWNSRLIEEVASSIAREAAVFGIDVMLSPGVNIQRDVLCGRNFEYLSEDPLLTGYLAAAYINGLQSENIGAAIKHFAGNNQETSRSNVDAQITERALREIYLTGFEIAIRNSRPWTVMTSYNRLNGDYTSMKEDLTAGILREEWGFRGLVMTDWGSGSDKVKLIQCGNDLSMPGEDKHCQTIELALKRGNLEEALLNACCENILSVVVKSNTMKRLNGEDGVPEITGRSDLEKGAKLAREAAAEGIVLLKNEGALPIADCEIALFGNGQIYTQYSGMGAGDINPPYRVSIRDGLEACESFTLNDLIYSRYSYAQDNNGINPREDDSEVVIQTGTASMAAKESACAVIVISRTTLEGYDHRAGEGDFCLSQREANLIRTVSQAFHQERKKVIVILNAGNPMETASWRDQVDAILYTGLGGQETGNAVADVLSGKVNPSGKLTASFPMTYASAPSYRNFPGNSNAVTYYEDIYVGYRFYETFDVETAYPFGHGLSYTTFEYTNAALSSSVYDGKVTVSVTVKNTGSVAGREVVQLYVRKPGVKQEQPALSLAAFAKTELLEPGQSQTVTMTVDEYSLRTYVTEESAWILEAGEYTLWIASSVQALGQEVTLQVLEEVLVQDVENRCAPQESFDVLTQKGGLPDYLSKINLAVGKPVTADASQDGGYLPFQAADGDYTTRWSGFATSPDPVHWLQIDLEQVYELEQITIYWEAIQDQYQVQIAEEANGSWKEIAAGGPEDSTLYTIKLTGEKARYIRIQAGKAGYVSIYEVEVYEKKERGS